MTCVRIRLENVQCDSTTQRHEIFLLIFLKAIWWTWGIKLCTRCFPTTHFCFKGLCPLLDFLGHVVFLKTLGIRGTPYSIHTPYIRLPAWPLFHNEAFANLSKCLLIFDKFFCWLFFNNFCKSLLCSFLL